MTAVAKLDEIMEKAQEFASTWSLVGGKFDDGTLLAVSQERKEELRALIRATLSPAELGGVELTFAAFRAANVARCVKWHPEGIASWSPSDWLTAVTGELGELASLLKMRNRERDRLAGNKFSPTDKMVSDELADVLTYLDLLAEVLGVDLGRAAVAKFNEVSERVGFTDRIDLSTPRAAEAVSEEVQDAVDSILSQLGGWAKAYPLDIFSEPTDEEREWLHTTKQGLMDRIAASMGRHMAKCIAEDLAALTASLTPPSAKGE